jgi:hypothetical protein
LVELELGADHDYRTPRIVHAFTQQVSAETAFLAFEKVAEGFQFTATAAGERLDAL